MGCYQSATKTAKVQNSVIQYRKSLKKCNIVQKSVQSAKRYQKLLMLVWITVRLLYKQGPFYFNGFVYFQPQLLVPTFGNDCLYLLLVPPFFMLKDSGKQAGPLALQQHSLIGIISNNYQFLGKTFRCLYIVLIILFYLASIIIFYLAVVILCIAKFATNKWQLPHKKSQIRPVFLLQFLNLFYY